MEIKENIRAAIFILLATVVLTLSVTFNTTTLILTAFISFLVIILSNILAKKAIGYYFETSVKTKFWSLYYFWFRKDTHFKKPVPMIWLPLLLALFTKGFIWWLAVLEFDIVAKSERVSKRHGLYRFTEVTEWHMAIIAMWGIIANVILAMIGYFIGFEFLAKMSIYYAAWSLLPISSLDGSKIFFGSKSLWIFLAIIMVLLVGWVVAI